MGFLDRVFPVRGCNDLAANANVAFMCQGVCAKLLCSTT